jgi:hypothetical protein
MSAKASFIAEGKLLEPGDFVICADELRLYQPKHPTPTPPTE